MRKNFLSRVLSFLLVTGLLGSSLYGVDWNSGDMIAANVTDDDINIAGGAITIDEDGANPGTVLVHAANQDIAVNVSGASTLQNVATGERGLNFKADVNQTITFNLDNDLTVRSANEEHNFIFALQGEGQFVFNFNTDGADRTLTLDGSTVNSDSAGAFMMVGMDANLSTPKVIMQRTVDSNHDAVLNIGSHSYFGFMSADNVQNNETAIVRFDGTNATANTGRMRVNIADNATFAVQSIHNDTSNLDQINYRDLDFTTLVGAKAEIQVHNNDIGTPSWSSLLVVNSNETYPSQLRREPWGSFSTVSVGHEPGAIVGRNGQITINDGAYFDYVGNASNITLSLPDPSLDSGFNSTLAALAVNGVAPNSNEVIKDRNPSALIVDGIADPFDAGPKAIFSLLGNSKMYFRSAVDGNGSSGNADFTVNAADQLTGLEGYGSVVLDVEGALNITGDDDGSNAINILSQEENDIGGSVLIGDSDMIFKSRNHDGGEYGKACFLINNRVEFENVALQHTDTLHQIFDKNIIEQAEASYIGGESFKVLSSEGLRPTMVFKNAEFLLHTSAALAGVDILVPDNGSNANNSTFTFFHNGYNIDKGTGRNLILGTRIGALASDLGNIIDRDAHFDVKQEFDSSVQDIVAEITTAGNNNKVTESDLTSAADISGEFSVHSLFLGHGSNISLGMPSDEFSEPTVAGANTGDNFSPVSNGTLFINGSFISLESQGGRLKRPETSLVTGEGGIFVDNYGLLELANNRRARIGTMIGTSFNGAVDMSARQVFFADRVGISTTSLDLSDASQRTIISAGSVIDDFTLNWKYVTRDFDFMPYIPSDVPSICDADAPVSANIDTLPVVAGNVRQLQILNSRLGDPAHVHINGGKVGELAYLPSEDSGAAPVGTIVLSNNAQVGLGNKRSSSDSSTARILLGVNGVNVIADGDAELDLNEDVIVDNVCHFLPGPNFGANGSNQLRIMSSKPQELRVKEGATLDMSLFNSTDKKLVIGGEVQLVFEPGSRMVFGGGVLEVTDNANVIFERYFGDAGAGTALTDTNDYRVRIGGTGQWTLNENAAVFIKRDAYVGIESLGVEVMSDSTGHDVSDQIIKNCSYVTDVTMTLNDDAKVLIGSHADFGGVLQVGNVANQSSNNAAVSFNLTINGSGALFEINSQGFLGFGVGIKSKAVGAPNNWRVEPLHNVDAVTINVNQGIFKHNQILSGDDENASLIAFGEVGAGYNFSFDDISARLLGGGNIMHVTQAGNPTVTTTASDTVGILSSAESLLDTNNAVPVFPVAAGQVFAYLKANAFDDQSTKIAQISEDALNTSTLGYIHDTTIVRDTVSGIFGASGSMVNPQGSLGVGAVGIALSESGNPTAYSIRP